MRDFIKPALWFAFFFAIGLTLVNDLGGVLYNQLRAQDVAQQTVEQAIQTYQSSGQSEIEASRVAQEFAKGKNARVYGWQLEGNKLTVWVEIRSSKDKTWVVGKLWSDFETATLAKSQFTDNLR